MNNANRKPVVLPANEGRKLNVIGNQVTLKLSSRESGGDYYVFEAVTPPGGGVPPHVHQHEDEIIYVLAGEYEFMLGEETFKGTAGATVNFPRNVPHSFKNIGSKPGRTFWTITPGAAFEKFFDDLAALPEGPPDLQKVAEIFGKYDIQILAG